MPICKRIPLVVSHDSDSSSEDEEEQLYTTPSTELPEIHTNSLSCSSSSECEDFEDCFSSEQKEVLLDTVSPVSLVESKDSTEKRDNFTFNTPSLTTETRSNTTQIQLPINHERAGEIQHVKHPILLSNHEEVKNSSSSEVYNLQVHSSDEDMDISEDDLEPNTTIGDKVTHCEPGQDSMVSSLAIATRKEDELTWYLKRCGITYETALTKYCVMKFDRIYCNFNPGKKRGCQIHFPKESLHDLASHLEFYHGIEYDIYGKSEDAKILVAEDTSNITEIDSQVVEVSDNSIDEHLYSEEITEREKTPNTVNTHSDYDPENDFVESVILVDQPNLPTEEEKKNTIKKEKTKTKAELKREKMERRKSRPFVSRVTPKVLRNRTTDPTPPPPKKYKTRSSKAPAVLDQSRKRGRPIGSTTKTPTIKALSSPRKNKGNPPVTKLEEVHSIAEISKRLRTLVGKSMARSKDKEMLISDSGHSEPLANRPPEAEVDCQNGECLTGTDLNDIQGVNNGIDMESSLNNNADNSAIQSPHQIMSETPNEPPLLITSKKDNMQQRESMTFTWIEENVLKAPSRSSLEETDKSKNAQQPESTASTLIEENISETSNKSPNATTSKVNIPQQHQSTTSILSEKDMASIPSAEWPFTLGFAFCTKSRFVCNVFRNLGTSCCRASFYRKLALIQHLDTAHSLNEEKAMQYRENEETEHFNGEIADFVFANNLFSNIVEDKSFTKMLTSMRGCDDESFVMPSSEHVRQLLHQKYEIYREKVKSLLQRQQHVTFITEYWRPDFDTVNNILITTARYLNSSWKVEEVVVAFHNMPRKSRMATVDFHIRTETDKIIRDLNISGEYYSIIVYFKESSDMTLTFKIPTEKFVQYCRVPCLDVIIKYVRKELFYNLQNRLPSFRKINNAYYTSCYSSNKEALFKLQQTLTDEKGETVMLTDIHSIIEQYNLACISKNPLKQYALDENDRSKVEKFARLNQILKTSLAWLERSSTSRIPISSKAFAICMQMMAIVREIAECYGINHLEDFLKEFVINKEDTIEASLKEVFKKLHEFSSSIKQEYGNPLWQAMVLDTAAFAAYDASTRSNQPEDDLASASEVSAAFCVQSQASEIERILDAHSKRDDTTTTASESSKSKDDDTVGQPFNSAPASGLEKQINRKRSFDDIVPIQTSTNAQNKRKCSECTASEIPKFDKNIYQFKKDQYRMLTSSGIDYTMGKRLEEYDFLSSESYLRQTQFWENADAGYYPNIARIIRKNATIPITTQQWLSSSQAIKQHYTGLKYSNPKADVLEMQEKALVYIWRKENNMMFN